MVSGADSIAHRWHVPGMLEMAKHGGHHEGTNVKQKTDQTVLAITKALNKTNYCTFTAKK